MCVCGRRLVDADCKWGLNRAGRPPDAFWERSACNPVRKLTAQDNEIRCVHYHVYKYAWLSQDCIWEAGRLCVHRRPCLHTPEKAARNSIRWVDHWALRTWRPQHRLCKCSYEMHVYPPCRLLRVELGMPPQQSLLRSRAAKAHSKQGHALAVSQSGNVTDMADEPASRDDRMLRELQGIAAALQEIKAGGGISLGRAGMAK